MENKNRIFGLPRDIFENRKLILTLAKNDFKKKYAGSYLGAIWAFIQPIVNVLVYWFVFGLALKPSAIMTKESLPVPFVLWLVGGLIPWFFFQEALNGTTNSLVEYSYLVKKVVFKIDILPTVKLVSALFIHLFFIAFAIFFYLCYGFKPDFYWLQILYYSVAMCVMVLGIGYLTSSIVLFFRDLSQIINIGLQVLVWITPIMWQFGTIAFPAWVNYALKLNPMFYIVQGYRDALINKYWFWQHPYLTPYFWIFTLVFCFVGGHTFRKLRIHFADVL